MTFQWTAVASFLYAEIGVLLLLCIPFVSPLRWKQIFRFQLWATISPYWNKAFLSIIVVLIVLFLDAAREVKKYSATQAVDKNAKVYPSSYDHIHMKLFRSQRNLYISGFSLFLWLVLRRVVSLIMQLAGEMESHNAMKAQVENANQAAKKYMEDNENLKKTIERSKAREGDQAITTENEKLKQEIEQGKKELNRTVEALSKSQAEVSALKKQSEGLTREYDRLIREHEQLQNTTDERVNKKDE
ncbi:B-cell receptor-associated protein 29 [Spea bombifrons]|uniref:B-cell receptor-associated protein 29 n=1 Tax=Spea bombifrons TaxID=233779 RepID=UPI00234AA883|nr:B-cell receptor-associated protein 29 [Spea bombifrons]XP_053321677.1 B-cell receptor-associated protein 29 [Spea bombifrons]